MHASFPAFVAISRMDAVPFRANGALTLQRRLEPAAGVPGHAERVSPTKRLPAGAARRLSLACASLALAGAGAFAAEGPWVVAGNQGLVRIVIVPAEHASDRAAYERQIQVLCDPERTCFLNFFTNSTGAPLAVPVPDAIANEATATYRRSAKNGVQVFKWSCRMKMATPECF